MNRIATPHHFPSFFWIPLLFLLSAGCSHEWKNLPLVDETVDLGGTWRIRFDPSDEGRAMQWMRAECWTGAEAGVEIPVPAAWETIPEGAGYDGIAWYMRRFSLPDGLPAHAVAILQFDAVNYGATLYVNNEEVCYHEGAYTGFEARLPDPAPGREYLLVVRVADPGEEPIDGMTLEEIPHSKESWYYNYGGIIGDVRLLIQPEIRIKDLFAAFTRPEGVSAAGQNEISFTLENNTPLQEEVPARITIRDPSTDSVLLEEEDTFSCPAGDKTILWDVGRVSDLEPWSPDSPNLYELELFIEGGHCSHRRRVTFGARRFAMDEDGFRLNDEPLFVRAVLYQPYYPGTLARPPDDGWVEREVAQIKGAGFNMVRAHIRPAPEAFLRECDRKGLAVMAEPGFGWIKKESPKMRERVMNELEGTITSSRNHACIVMWGMLNELSGKIYPLCDELMQRVRALDPTRLVTGDSGGFTGISHYLNPYDTEFGEYYDVHLYKNYPLMAPEWQSIDSLGAGGKGPVFVSEFSFGGMTDLEEAQAFFKDRPFLEDAKEYAEQWHEAGEALQTTPLKRTFSSWHQMMDLANEVQSEAALVIGGALLSHPGVAGYCYTQFQDAAWEISAGITDIVGRPKPVYEAMRRLNAMPPREGGYARPEPLRVASTHQAKKSGKEGTIHSIKLPPFVTALLDRRWNLKKWSGPVSGEGPAIVVSGGFLTLTKEENVERLARLFHYVHEGGVLVYLRPPRLDNELDMMKLGNDHDGVAVDLPVTLIYEKCVGGFLGKFHYVDPAFDLFAGFESPPAYLGKGIDDLLPRNAHLPVETEGVIVPVGCFDCYGQFVGGHLLAVPYGEGYFVINHFRLIEEMKGSLVARRLLDGVMEFAFGLAKDPRTSGTGKMSDIEKPSFEWSRRISGAARELRRAFCLFQRLMNITAGGGKRKRTTLTPAFLEANTRRLAAIDLLARGRYSECAEAMNRFWDGLSDEFKRFVNTDERFIKKFHALPRNRQEDMEARRIKKLRSEALQKFSEGEHAKAFEIMKQAFDALQ